MATSNFNVRLDSELRSQATQILADYGLSPTQAVKLFFNQIVHTQKVPLRFDYNAKELSPNAETQQAMEEALNRTDFSESYATNEEILQAIQNA